MIRNIIRWAAACAALSIFMLATPAAQAACGASQRLPVSAADCLYMYSESENWIKDKHYAMNVCFSLGGVVAKLDLETIGDKTFYLNHHGWKSQGSAKARVNGRYCCRDGGMCNASEKISTSKCQAAWNESRARHFARNVTVVHNNVAPTNLGVTEEVERHGLINSCSVSGEFAVRNAMMTEVTWVRIDDYRGVKNRDALLVGADWKFLPPERLKKMDWYMRDSEFVFKDEDHYGESATPACGNRFCAISDCKHFWNRSDAAKLRHCEWASTADWRMVGDDMQRCQVNAECHNRDSGSSTVSIQSQHWAMERTRRCFNQNGTPRLYQWGSC